MEVGVVATTKEEEGMGTIKATMTIIRTILVMATTIEGVMMAISVTIMVGMAMSIKTTTTTIKAIIVTIPIEVATMPARIHNSNKTTTNKKVRISPSMDVHVNQINKITNNKTVVVEIMDHLLPLPIKPQIINPMIGFRTRVPTRDLTILITNEG